MKAETWHENQGKGIDDVIAQGGEPKAIDAQRMEEELRRTIRADAAGAIEKEILKSDFAGASDSQELQRLIEAGPIPKLMEDGGLEAVDLIEILRSNLDLSDDALERLSKTLSSISKDAALDAVDQKISAAKAIIWETRRHRLVRDPSGEIFVILELHDHRRVLPFEGKEYREWVSHAVFENYGVAPSDSAFGPAGRVLAHDADASRRQDVHLRVARTESGVAYDLADSSWTTIKVTPSGWGLDADPEVLFRRFQKTRAQVVPARGGRLDMLWSFLRVKDDRQRRLITAWLVSALIPGSPRPVLVFTGEHGTAKSTSARCCRRLIDPCVTEVITPPSKVEELAQVAMQGYVLALDNVSSIPTWMSDALCRTVTGDSFEKRKLYTDQDSILWSYQRPVIINGIGAVVTRPDLLDRTLLVELQPFGDGERKPEEAFWREFDEARPLLLGALFDAVAGVLDCQGAVEVPQIDIRMLDFFRFGIACERALGWPRGSFAEDMIANARRQVEESIDASPVAGAILDWASRHVGETHEFTAAALLARLKADNAGEGASELPKQPNALSRAIARLAASLRKLGVNVTKTRSEGRARTRLIRVEVQNNRPQPSEPSANPDAGARHDSSKSPQVTSFHGSLFEEEDGEGFGHDH